MQIGVNLMFLVPGEVGGSEPLLTNLVTAISEAGVSPTVYAVRGFSLAYPLLASRAQIVEVPWSSGAQAARILSEHTWLPLSVRKRNLSLIHHGVGTVPLFKPYPTVVTIHDIQFVHYPENFVKPKRWWLKLNVPHAAVRSDSICVPSDFVKNDIVEHFQVDPDRIFVVPFGSEGLLGPDPSSTKDVKRRYELGRPFFFYPGRSYPHKNHLMLLRAFKPLADRADLVLTGPPWFHDAQVMEVTAELGIEDSVKHLGLVPRRDLAGLYSGAAALAYPSRFEGFGAPALEAMSQGCPVVSSDVAAVPEVLGDAGILLDPDDEEAWTAALEKILEDSKLRRDLSTKGRNRASHFSWKRSAQLQIEAYENAIQYA